MENNEWYAYYDKIEGCIAKGLDHELVSTLAELFSVNHAQFEFSFVGGGPKANDHALLVKRGNERVAMMFEEPKGRWYVRAYALPDSLGYQAEVGGLPAKTPRQATSALFSVINNYLIERDETNSNSGI